MTAAPSKIRYPQLLSFALLFGLLTAGAIVWHQPFRRALLFGFDVAAIGYCMVTLWAAVKHNAARLRETAARDDANRGILLSVCALVIAVILYCVGFEVMRPDELKGAELLLIPLTLFTAWLFANLVAARHYAHLFYDKVKGKDRGGLSFPGTKEPDLRDFIYFSLVLGMTFQVSDVEITSGDMRVPAMVHGAASFFFSIGVLALTVNVLAGSR
jgi:uncharacterized membrane protein